MKEEVDLSLLPPDLVIVVSTLLMLQILEVVQRKYLGPSSKTYRILTYRDRFEWDRKFLNVIFQIIQTIFNVYIVVYDELATADVLYGYSKIAHIGFLVIISFYIYDGAGIVMHPLPSSNSSMWLIHHFIAIGLLVFNVSYKQSSAFPASVFLLSAAGHIPNEIRWFLSVFNVRNQLIIKCNQITLGTIVFFTFALPPPYLIIQSAKQLQVSIFDVIFHKMQFYCIFFFLLIYIPHILIIVVQFRRIYLEWDKGPQPFRQKRVH